MVPAIGPGDTGPFDSHQFHFIFRPRQSTLPLTFVESFVVWFTIDVLLSGRGSFDGNL